MGPWLVFPSNIYSAIFLSYRTFCHCCLVDVPKPYFGLVGFSDHNIVPKEESVYGFQKTYKSLGFSSAFFVFIYKTMIFILFKYLL